MATEQIRYKRLPGSGMASEGFIVLARERSRLYLGDDHLLRLNTNGWTENYRRFYFNDIESFVICRNSRGVIWNIVTLALMAGSILFLLAMDDKTARIILGCVTALFLVIFLVNLLLGPTCVTRVQTRTGVEPLPSLQRVRRARAVIDRVRPFIQAAQGEPAPAVEASAQP